MIRRFEVVFTRTRLPVSMAGSVASRSWARPWVRAPCGGRRRSRSRGSIAAAVGAVLPAPVRGELLDGPPGDDFVEDRLLVARLAEDAAEALDVLADGAGAGEDDRDVRLGDVDAFVQHPRGRDDRERPRVEPEQDLAPLLGLGLVGDDGDEELPRDLVDGGIVMREDQDPVAVVP